MTSRRASESWSAKAPSAARFRQIRLVVTLALAFLTAFLALLLLAWRRAGSPGIDVYLSQLGASGQPGAGPYRLAVLCVGGATALVAVAWRLRAPAVGAAGFLGLSAAMFVVSASVPCAPGCPIPVRDGLSTLPNLVHFSVSGAAFALAVAAMSSVGAADVDPALRRRSDLAARIAMVLYGVLAALMLAFGHGLANGIVERFLAVLSLAWLTMAALALCRRPAAP